MSADPRRAVSMHLDALNAGLSPWLPLTQTRPDVGADIYDTLVWEGFQADYPEFFDAETEAQEDPYCICGGGRDHDDDCPRSPAPEVAP